MTVDQMIDDILKREGGYVGHPQDRGGPTKYGITLKTMQAYAGKTERLTADDVKELTEPEAYEIYYQQYFIAPGIDKLPEPLQPFAFDCAVNHGPKRAVQFVQRECGAKADGAIGPATVKAAAQRVFYGGSAFLLCHLIEARKQFYHDIVRGDESQGVFLKGWINRLCTFLTDEGGKRLREGRALLPSDVLMP